jgi:signal transduction histidine kinase
MKWSYIISFAAGILFFTLLTWSLWWLAGGAIVFLGVWSYQLYAERRYIHFIKTSTLEKQLRELQVKLDRSVSREQQLTRVAEQANIAKKQLLATLNQEIRTPVNGMAGMALLLSETPLNDQQREYITGIQHCGEQLVAVVNHILVDDLLNTSIIGVDDGHPREERLDLRGTIKDVLALFSGRVGDTGPVLSAHIDEEVPEQLAGDGGRLKHIMINLVDNAVKNTSHGEISIEARVLKIKDDGKVELGFEVRDTGNGIPASRIGKLFEGLSPVVPVAGDNSVNGSGNNNPGLGLVVCRRLVGMMDGSISVQSEPGRGCVFSFRVCISAVGAPVTRQPLSAGVPTFVSDEVRNLAFKI